MDAHKKPSPTASKVARPKKPTPITFKLFFLVAGILLAGAAIRYLEEKNFLQHLQQQAQEKQKMQEALGWGSELKIDKKVEPLAKIRFMLRDKNHAPIKGALVQITLSHAAETKDILTQNSITLPLTMVEPGVYRGQAKIPLPGEWEASVSAQIGDSSYQISERLTLP